MSRSNSNGFHRSTEVKSSPPFGGSGFAILLSNNWFYCKDILRSNVYLDCSTKFLEALRLTARSRKNYGV